MIIAYKLKGMQTMTEGSDRYAELSFEGRITGRTVLREAAREMGRSYGIAYTVFISGDSFLLQERSINKESQPGCWDLSAGGHVELCDAQGTDDVDVAFRRAAIREAHEEIGIHLTPDDLRLLLCFNEDNVAESESLYRKHYRVYSCEVKMQEWHPRLNEMETSHLQWVTTQQLANLPDSKITKELRRYRAILQSNNSSNK